MKTFATPLSRVSRPAVPFTRTRLHHSAGCLFSRYADVTTWLWCLSLSLLLPAHFLGAQTPDLVVKSRLVVLDTVVTDPKGEPVTNLTRDDFEVYDNGVLQIIRNFDKPSDRPAIPTNPIKDHNGNENWGEAPLAMILVDEMDTPFSEMAYARERVQKYLKAQPPLLTEPTILLWLDDSGIHGITGFTRDRTEILNAVMNHPPSFGSKSERGAVVEEILTDLAALQQAAIFSRGSKGKKEIIWVGRSFPAISPEMMEVPEDQEMLKKALRTTVDILLVARVSIYVIDPTATSSAVDTDSDTPVLQGNDPILPLEGSSIIDPFSEGFNLNLFVKQTGGKYFTGYTELDHEVSESVERGVAFYTLTYTPPPGESDIDYHKITIRTKNRELIVQTKEGYYNGVDTGTLSASDQKKLQKQSDRELGFDLYEASVTNMRYTGLGLHVDSCKRDSDKVHSICTVDVDTNAITFHPDDSGNDRAVILALVSSLDAKGKLIYHSVEELTAVIPSSQQNKIQHGHLHLTLHSAVPHGADHVRVVLRDASGRIGTADVEKSLLPNLVSSVPVKN